jgi:hypothetical protein
MVVLMFISIATTIMISNYAERKASPTGNAAIDGTVGVYVTDGSVLPPETPSGGGGGGSESGLLRTPIIHLLDFINKDLYIIASYKDDQYIAIFPKSNYTFLNKDTFGGYSNLSLLMSIKSLDFYIKTNEVVKLDLDLDGENDLSITFDGKEITFTSLHRPIQGPESPPKISKENIVQEPGVNLPFFENFNYVGLILLVLLFITITLTTIRLKRKTSSKEETKAIKIFNEYKEKSKNKNRVFDSDRENVYSWLNKERILLEKSYKMKSINEETYKNGKERIDSLIKKL